MHVKHGSSNISAAYGAWLYAASALVNLKIALAKTAFLPADHSKGIAAAGLVNLLASGIEVMHIRFDLVKSGTGFAAVVTILTTELFQCPAHGEDVFDIDASSLVRAEFAAAIEGLTPIGIEPRPEQRQDVEVFSLRFSIGVGRCAQVDPEQESNGKNA